MKLEELNRKALYITCPFYLYTYLYLPIYKTIVFIYIYEGAMANFIYYLAKLRLFDQTAV